MMDNVTIRENTMMGPNGLKICVQKIIFINNVKQLKNIIMG
jgi:hypothetical protein